MEHTDKKPLIARKDSAKSTRSTSSSKSGKTVSTYYSEDDVKELGYRPFEYYKVPRTAAKKQRPPPSSTITNTTRAAALRAAANNNNHPRPPMPPPPPPPASTNSQQDFEPPPKVKLLEVRKYYLNDAATAAVVPPSPRVKDRYAARMAAKRSARARARAISEWPGWAPDEKALLGGGGEKKNATTTTRRRPTSAASTILLQGTERWTSPGTWRRRVWGIVVSAGMLVLIAVIILATTLTSDNAPSVRLPPRAVFVGIGNAAEVAAVPLPVVASSTVSVASDEAMKPRRLVARRFRG